MDFVNENLSPVPVNVGKTSSEFYNSDDFEYKNVLSGLKKIEPQDDALEGRDKVDAQFFPNISDDESTDFKIQDNDESDNEADHFEEDISDESGVQSLASNDVSPDEHLYCPHCRQWVNPDCAAHPTVLIESGDEYITIDQITRGAVASRTIPVHALIGPCEGRIVDRQPGESVDDGYLWEIDTFDEKRRLLYAAEEYSHWSACLTPAIGSLKANVYAVQIRGEIYFRAVNDIEVGEQVIVYRGDRRGSHFQHTIPRYNTAHKQSKKPKRNRPIDNIYLRVPGEKDLWQCRSCQFQTDVYGRMRYHSKMCGRKPGEKLFECGVCSKKLSTPSSLSNHMRLHRTGKERKYSCTKCDWSFRMKHHLDRHIKLAHGNDKGSANRKGGPPNQKVVNGYHCDLCQTKFPYKSTLNNHMITVHDRQKQDHYELTPTPCQECGKVLKNLAALKVHVAKLHKQRNDLLDGQHGCDLCGKQFGGKNELRYHIMRHTGEFPFKCDKCGFGYPTQSELRKHQKKAKKCNGNHPSVIQNPSTSETNVEANEKN